MKVNKSIHTTPLSELLLDIGITADHNDKSGQKVMLYKNGRKIGRYTAEQAHNRFILKNIPYVQS